MNIRQLSVLVCVVAISVLSVRPAQAGETNGAKSFRAESGGEAAITGAVLETDDDTVLFQFNFDGQAETGVPMLSKIPYVARLFKNVGKGSQTVTIRVPKTQIESSGEACVIKTSNPGAIEHATEELPSPSFLIDEVQYFSADTSPLAAVKSAPCASSRKLISVHSCEAACNATCPVATKVACDNCKCGTSCACGKSGVAHNAKLHEQLIRALTENAHIKARLEAQQEIAEQKERFLHELVEAKVEVVKLQARLELASQREQLVHQQRSPQPHGQPQYNDRPLPPPTVSMTDRLRNENEALKAKIAELEQRLATKPVAPHSAFQPKR